MTPSGDSIEDAESDLVSYDPAGVLFCLKLNRKSQDFARLETVLAVYQQVIHINQPIAYTHIVT
jgi:hypothetical protein